MDLYFRGRLTAKARGKEKETTFNRMRTAWLLSLVALTVSARPVSEGNSSDFKVQPNDVDVLGGDFGLANSRLKIEIYNNIAGYFRNSGSGPPPKSALTNMINQLINQSGKMSMWEGLGGDLMLDWLYSQFWYLMLGTDSDDPNTLICRSYEPLSKTSWLFNVVTGGGPARPGEICDRDYSGGAGPYKANYTVDPSLPSRTLYAPINPPKNVSMPVIIWGGCLASGVMYANFLTEVASHGYFAIATGLPVNSMGGTTVSDMTRNIDWVMHNAAVKKYGNIDTTKIIAAGHNCGGLEALSGTYRDPRVMMTMVFNSGISDDTTREKLKELSKPVAYFEGDPQIDYAYKYVGVSLSMFNRYTNNAIGRKGLQPNARKDSGDVCLYQECF
jgi:hypothetical protein